MHTKKRIRLTRRLVVGWFILTVTLMVSVLLTRLSPQTHDAAQYALRQTSAKASAAEVRYRLPSANGSGATPVLLPELNGGIEQVLNFQPTMSSREASLAYDRTTYGVNGDALAYTARLTQSQVIRVAVPLLIIVVALIVGSIFTEFVLDARNVARYMPGQTFVTVGNARIRYRLVGADHPYPTVVLLSGLNGSIEQLDNLQRTLSSVVPALAYDRAGYGFSEGSTAHSAEEQANELAALLHALKLQDPIVLVAYSFSSPIARVFASRFPEKTAGMYLIEPTMPELNERMPELHTPRRYYARFIVYHLLASSFGYIRLIQRIRNWRGPTSLVEQRAEAVLARRSHYWALAQEWYALPESWRQTLAAPIPPSLPLEVAIPKQAVEEECSNHMAKLYADLAARSSRGRLLELEGVEHTLLLKPGPVLDRLVTRITQLVQANAASSVPPRAG
jgi:pimeloyl-ACP methyl ester carboxylesterase